VVVRGPGDGAEGLLRQFSLRTHVGLANLHEHIGQGLVLEVSPRSSIRLTVLVELVNPVVVDDVQLVVALRDLAVLAQAPLAHFEEFNVLHRLILLLATVHIEVE